MDFLFPEYRLDWFGAGPSSPNKTGALLAILFVVSWWPVMRYRWGYWLSLPLAFVAAGFLLQTESRGAIVGAVSGLLILAVGGFLTKTKVDRLKTLKERLKSNAFMLRALSLVVALCLLVFYSHQLGVNDRMTAMTSGEDGSTNVRFALYSAGLQMIADAPLGWGHGQAGNTYGQWYQEVGDSRSYLSLVNSHLTWMADYGMLFQLGYIAGWCFVFFICWPFDRGFSRRCVPVDAIGMASLRDEGGSDVALATSSVEAGDAIRSTSSESLAGVASLRAVAFVSWVVLGICGFFSSVLTLLWLWVIPVLLLSAVLVQRCHLRCWPTRRSAFLMLAAALLSFLCLEGLAHVVSGEPRIHANAVEVRIGEVPSSVAIIQPDRQILGDKYGHTIREYLGEIGGATVLQDVSAVEDVNIFDCVLLSGAWPQLNLSDYSGRLVWMNPPSNVSDDALEALGERTLTIVVGSLGDWRRVRLWQSLADENPKWNLIELRGVANYIPNWPKYIKEGEGE
jgi:hypothetical protein